MSLLTLLKARFAAVVARPAVVTPTPVSHVSLDDQMERLDSVVSSSLDRMILSSRYHLAAEDQLDAAAYALREVMRDLASVMTISPLRSGAALYQMPVYGQTRSSTPLAARAASAAAA